MSKKKKRLMYSAILITWSLIIYILITFLSFNLGVLAIFAILYIEVYVTIRLNSRYQWVQFHYEPRRFHKLILVISLGILLVLFNPKFNSTIFLMKHFILFLYISSMITYIIINVYKKFRNNNDLEVNKVRLLKGFVVVTTFVTIGLFSRLQLYFIDNYVVPPVYGCSYYDDYNNLIYNSEFVGTCPELQDVTITETEDGHRLSFSVYEESIDHVNKDFQNLLKYSKRKHTINADITYVYDKNNRITDYNIEFYKKVYDVYLDETTTLPKEKTGDYELNYVLYFKKSINNTYSISQVKSVHKTYKNYYKQEPGSLISFSEDSLSQVDPIIEEYRSILSPVNDEQYSIDIDYRIIDEDERKPFKDLYTITYRETDYIGERLYTIHRNDSNSGDQIRINRGCYGDCLSVLYQTDAFDESFTLERKDYKLNNRFENQSYYINESFDSNNQRLDMSDTDLLGEFTSLLSKEDYGYKLKHHHYLRDKWNRYFITHPAADTGIKPQKNILSVDLENLYSGNYTYSVTPWSENNPVPLVYNQNPLLFEGQLMYNKEN